MPNRVAPLGGEENANASFSLLPSAGSPSKSRVPSPAPIRSFGSMQRNADQSLPLRIETQGKNRPKGISFLEDADKDKDNDDSEDDDDEIAIGREQSEQLGALQKDSSRLRGKSFLLQVDKEKAIYKNIAEKTQHMYSVPRYVLDPRKKFMQRWDLVIAVLLVFTAVVTPFEVAYISTKEFWEPLFIINRLVDLCFVLDMMFQFNLMYLDDKNMWITNRWQIAKKYILGSFFIDFVSILPFDVVGMVMGDGSIQQLKILRILRLMRLFKLLRILRSGRVFRRLEDILKMGYAMMTLLKFIFGTLAIAHWMACAWMMVQGLEGSCTNWIITYFPPKFDEFGEEIDFCGPIPLEECEENSYRLTCTDCETCDCSVPCGKYFELQSPGQFLGISVFHLYVTSFYWSLVTMSTIGYGDVLPNTLVERIFTIMAMIFGTSVFAYVVGSVCGIVQNLDKRSTEFYELMDNLSSFATENTISDDLNSRLKAYFRYRSQYTSISEWGDLMRLMSPALRGEVAMLKCGKWVKSIPYFTHAPAEFIVDVSMRLVTKTFPQSEQIICLNDLPEELFIIERGIVGCKGRVVVRGKVLGAELMLTNYPSGYIARALTYTDLYALHRDEMKEVLNKFPDVGEALRKATCKEICRRQTLSFAKLWTEITTAGQLVATGGMSRSSFRSLQYNPAERGRRARESFLRDTAIQALKGAKRAAAEKGEIKSSAPEKVPSGKANKPLLPYFPPMPMAEFRLLLQDEEIRQNSEEAEPSEDGKKEMMRLMENQRSMMSEISTLTRTVQKLNAQILNSKGEGSLGHAVSSGSLGPPGPTRENSSVPGMPQFHDYLDSSQRRVSNSDGSSNLPLRSMSSKPRLPSLRRESDPYAILEKQDSPPSHPHVRFEKMDSPTPSAAGDAGLSSQELDAFGTTATSMKEIESRNMKEIGALSATAEEMDTPIVSGTTLDLEENAGSANAAATATVATDEVKESKDAFAAEGVEGKHAADSEEVEEKGNAAAADKHSKAGTGADDVIAHQPVAGTMVPRDAISGGGSMAAPEAQDAMLEQNSSANPQGEEDLMRMSGGLTGKDSES